MNLPENLPWAEVTLRAREAKAERALVQRRKSGSVLQFCTLR